MLKHLRDGCSPISSYKGVALCPGRKEAGATFTTPQLHLHLMAQPAGISTTPFPSQPAMHELRSQHGVSRLKRSPKQSRIPSLHLHICLVSCAKMSGRSEAISDLGNSSFFLSLFLCFSLPSLTLQIQRSIQGDYAPHEMIALPKTKLNHTIGRRHEKWRGKGHQGRGKGGDGS